MANILRERAIPFIRKRWVAILVVLGVVIAAFLMLSGGARGGALASDFQTVTLERGNLTATIGATGSVRANQSATLTWETSGTVEQVNVQVGDRVSEDDVLAGLELTSLPQSVILALGDLQTAQDDLEAFYDSYGPLGIAEAQQTLANAQDAFESAQRSFYSATNPGDATDIDQAFANMILARDQLDKAREDYEPYANKPENNLERANLLIRFTEAQQEYDAAVRKYNSFASPSNQTGISVAAADLALAEAQRDEAQEAYDDVLDGPTEQQVAAAEGRVAAAEALLGQAYVEAPFDGIVTDAFPHEGDLASAGAVAFQLDDLDSLLVDVDVSEVDINRVAVGQTASITFDAAPESEYHGEVVSVALAGSIVDGAVNFRVTVELTDADEYVRPGMTAAINLVVTELEGVLLLPNRAVRAVDGERVVYVLRAGQLVPVAVSLGASSETYSELLGGDLEEGETIVLNPPSFTFEAGEPPQGGQFLIGN